ncbi:cation/H+ exchanger, Cation/H+ exchanger, CPA1 family [Artemisia annua]|uniref:Cation/H+ exchanger, Cation/H+ exchanger, CPA1 family n=1 Tax=Artemisia annua TaxID=35608 RepID=A0A2U1M4Q9_ARTAN|nr:cation/H+ exchanger, Cation/H+ exchanger, CPA1 family [Artemisia annua]
MVYVLKSVIQVGCIRTRKRSTTGKNDAYDNDGFVDEERDIPQQVRDVHTAVKVAAYAPVRSVDMVATEMHSRSVIFYYFNGRVKIISNLKIWHVVGDITKVSTLLPTYFKGVKTVVNLVSVIVGPKEGDTPDRTKFSQIKGDSPEWMLRTMRSGNTVMLLIVLGVYPLTYQTISCHSFGTKMEMCSTVMLLIVLGRAAFVFPLSILSNYMHRSGGESSNISVHHQLVIWSAGLMRGAISIALAFKQLHFSVLLSGSVKEAMELIRWREQPDNYWYYSHRSLDHHHNHRSPLFIPLSTITTIIITNQINNHDDNHHQKRKTLPVNEEDDRLRSAHALHSPSRTTFTGAEFCNLTVVLLKLVRKKLLMCIYKDCFLFQRLQQKLASLNEKLDTLERRLELLEVQFLFALKDLDDGCKCAFSTSTFGCLEHNRFIRYEVGATTTLISPVECNLLWNQFLKETEDTITQALAFQFLHILNKVGLNLVLSVVAKYQLNHPRNIFIYTSGTPTEIRVRDCSWLTEEQFAKDI